jgi:ribosomal protein L2
MNPLITRWVVVKAGRPGSPAFAARYSGKGYKTRSKKKASDNYIIERRKK